MVSRPGQLGRPVIDNRASGDRRPTSWPPWGGKRRSLEQSHPLGIDTVAICLMPGNACGICNRENETHQAQRQLLSDLVAPELSISHWNPPVETPPPQWNCCRGAERNLLQLKANCWNSSIRSTSSSFYSYSYILYVNYNKLHHFGPWSFEQTLCRILSLKHYLSCIT